MLDNMAIRHQLQHDTYEYTKLCNFFKLLSLSACHVCVVLHRATSILNYKCNRNIKIHMIATVITILNHASNQWTDK